MLTFCNYATGGNKYSTFPPVRLDAVIGCPFFGMINNLNKK